MSNEESTRVVFWYIGEIIYTAQLYMGIIINHYTGIPGFFSGKRFRSWELRPLEVLQFTSACSAHALSKSNEATKRSKRNSGNRGN